MLVEDIKYLEKIWDSYFPTETDVFSVNDGKFPIITAFVDFFRSDDGKGFIDTIDWGNTRYMTVKYVGGVVTPCMCASPPFLGIHRLFSSPCHLAFSNQFSTL